MKQETATIPRRMPYGLFEAKVSPYEAYLKKIIYGIIRTPDGTDDLYCEVLQKIYFAMDSWSGTNFKAWIARIAVHHAIDEKKRRRGEPDWLSLDEIGEDRIPAPGSATPESDVITAETVYEIWRLIDGLDEIYRVPLTMYYRSNRSVREIAESLGLSARTVETRIYRARRMIREKWSNDAY